MKTQFIINEKPTGKGRVRVTGKGYSFTPEKTVLYENLVKLSYQQQCKNTYFDSAVRMEINIYYEIPKSYSKKRRSNCLAMLEYPTKKPDIDNCAKAILDALNNVAYKDDTQVISLTVNKMYTIDKPFTKVEIYDDNE